MGFEDLAVLSMSLLSKTVTFVIGALSVHHMLRYYDRRNAIAWRKVHDKMENEPMAMACYFGMRLLGFSILGAAIYG